MAKVKLDLRSKTDAVLQQFGETHASSISESEWFPDPIPTTQEYDEALGVFTTARDEAISAYVTYLSLIATKNQAREAFMHMLTRRGNYVEGVSGGDPTKILSAGFEVRDGNRSPVTIAAPVDFNATSGREPGEVDLSWGAIRAARVYIVECRPNEADSFWLQAAIVTRCSATVTDLQSGKPHLFRVKAVGAKGDGGWSNEIIKMAP